MRKSQIIGQTFVYLMGAIIFIVIVIYGYAKISELLDRQQQLCIDQMGLDLKAKVEEIGQTFDVNIYRLKTCGEWNRVCIWNYELSGPACSSMDWATVLAPYFDTVQAPGLLDSGSKPPETVRRQIMSCTENNMAVYRSGSIDVQLYNIGKARVGTSIREQMTPGTVPSPYIFNCFYAPRGNVYLRIQGKGSEAVIISDYPGRYENPHES